MDNKEIILIAVGDVVPGDKFIRAMKFGLNSSCMAGLVRRLKRGDILFGNLECPISWNGRAIFKAAPRLRGNPDTTRLLRELGLTIVNLANNHINDYGPVAIMETLHNLERSNIRYVGAGKDMAEADSPQILHARGQRVGFLAFCEKEESIATKTRPGAAEINEHVINREIDRLRDKVDYIVLSLHMGIEFVDFPSPDNINMCRRFVDRGVNVILGHHPHVPQGYELYNGGLIVYSLGNFIFDMGEQAGIKSKLGYVYEVVLSDASVAKVTPIPYKMDDNFVPYLVQNGEETNKLLIYLKRLSDPLKDRRKMEEMWYAATRFYTRELIKVLLFRTLRRGKWWFPLCWVRIVIRRQVRRVWIAYIGFLLKGLMSNQRLPNGGSFRVFINQ